MLSNLKTKFSEIQELLARLSRRDIVKSLKIGAIAGLFIIIGAYAIITTKDLIFGTRLDILSPDNGITVSDNHVRIVGYAPNAANIYVNDGKIVADQKGNFIQEYILANGLNIYTIRAEDRFGRQNVKTISLVYKDQLDNEQTP